MGDGQQSRKNLDMNILYLITARAGSKSIPNKNIKLLGGIPLIAFKIKLALSVSDNPSDIWVSTDSEEYAKISKEYGASVPFIRPKELATDSATSVDVVIHALNYAESINRKYDYVCLLEPTVPFLPSVELKKALQKLKNDPDADGIVAVREIIPHVTFIQEESYYVDEVARKLAIKGKNIRRQDFKRQITPSGGFYIIKTEILKREKAFYTNKTISHLSDDIHGIEIDEKKDWLLAQFLVDQGEIDIEKIFV